MNIVSELSGIKANGTGSLQVRVHVTNSTSSLQDYRIVVQSIGDAGAHLVSALKKALPFSETRLAALLYQAPGELVGNLAREQAENINELLRSTGLDSRVLGQNEAFTPGVPSLEVALAIKDVSQMTSVVQLVMDVLGVDPGKARQILCNSPTVLLGNVSSNTVDALRRRFGQHGVELDVSEPANACFDVFLGNCPARDSERVYQLLQGVGIAPIRESRSGKFQGLLAIGLSRKQADKVWDQIRRTNLPVRLVNRDYERFDVRLDEAPTSQEMLEYLLKSTGMPSHIAPKVLSKLPMVIRRNVSLDTMTEALEEVATLGGKASGHLLAFQTFAVAVNKVGDLTIASRLMQALGGLSQEESLKVLGPERAALGCMTHPQVHWLQHELKRAGTECKVILR